MLIEVIHVQRCEGIVQVRLAMSGFGLIGNFEPRDALPTRGVLTAWTRKIALHAGQSRSRFTYLENLSYVDLNRCACAALTGRSSARSLNFISSAPRNERNI